MQEDMTSHNDESFEPNSIFERSIKPSTCGVFQNFYEKKSVANDTVKEIGCEMDLPINLDFLNI